MNTVYDTRGYKKALFKGEFDKQLFIQDALKNGASSIMVETCFFPERAMYWTRMFRTAAEKQGIRLSAIICDSNLLAEDRESREAALADLSEWVRIAALSKIPALKIRISGASSRLEDESCRLVSLLGSVVSDAKRYGVGLIVSGNAGMNDADLLLVLKQLDFSVCRIEPAPGTRLDKSDGKWIFNAENFLC